MSDQDQWTVFAGIDWGGEHHQLCVIDQDGKKVLQLRVTHDVAGLGELDRQLRRFRARLRCPARRLGIGSRVG